MKTRKKKIFEPTRISDQKSKNPPASSCSENIEISTAVNISSLEHLTYENDPATEAFDFDIELDAHSKNPSIQHTENPKTLEKISDSTNSYELPALPVFDPSIDIDFNAYTTDTEAVIQPPATLPRRNKMQLSPFRDLALRNTSFD